MNNSYTYAKAVTFDSVDREQCLLMKALFCLLQEAAIKHADQHGVGAHAMAERGESWVLNRMVVEILRYPKYEETVTVHTWSTGIRSFKGYRDFRLYVGEELIGRGSSLWLYLNIAKKAITRVPAELAAAFPSRLEEAYEPSLEKAEWNAPDEGASVHRVGLRYSDIDANDHVNNTAYFEVLQSALAREGVPPVLENWASSFLRKYRLPRLKWLSAYRKNQMVRDFAIASGDVIHAKGMVWDEVRRPD